MRVLGQKNYKGGGAIRPPPQACLGLNCKYCCVYKKIKIYYFLFAFFILPSFGWGEVNDYLSIPHKGFRKKMILYLSLFLLKQIGSTTKHDNIKTTKYTCQYLHSHTGCPTKPLQTNQEKMVKFNWLIGHYDLVAPLVLILRTSVRKANLFSYILENQNIFVLLNSSSIRGDMIQNI